MKKSLLCGALVHGSPSRRLAAKSARSSRPDSVRHRAAKIEHSVQHVASDHRLAALRVGIARTQRFSYRAHIVPQDSVEFREERVGVACRLLAIADFFQQRVDPGAPSGEFDCGCWLGRGFDVVIGIYFGLDADQFAAAFQCADEISEIGVLHDACLSVSV